MAVAQDGVAATEHALQHTSDVMFLDIRMPGRTGLEVAEAVADDWPEGRAEALFAFITAFDEFAVAAFERAAADHVLKPATEDRLQITVDRLQRRLAARACTPAGADRATLFRTVQSLSAPAAEPGERLRDLVPGSATPCA